MQDAKVDEKVIRTVCGSSSNLAPRDRQFLFSFYSHTQPDYPGVLTMPCCVQSLAGSMSMRVPNCAQLLH